MILPIETKECLREAMQPTALGTCSSVSRWQILKRALEATARQIAENSAVDGIAPT